MLRLPVVRDVFFGGGRALGVDRFSGHGTEGPISMAGPPNVDNTLFYGADAIVFKEGDTVLTL
jgi:hypothetical protein